MSGPIHKALIKRNSMSDNIGYDNNFCAGVSTFKLIHQSIPVLCSSPYLHASALTFVKRS